MIMDEKVEYYKLPFYKRVTSVFMDIMLTFSLYLLLLLLAAVVVPNIMNNDSKLASYTSGRSVILYESNLYEIVDNKLVEVYEDDNIQNGFIFTGNFDKYNENKEKSKLFIVEDGQYIENGTEEELKKFYKENWTIAKKYIEETDEFKSYDEPYKKRMKLYLEVSLVVPAFISIIGLLIVVPFFNKDGKTISKYMFKISVVNENLENLNRLQIFTRQFFFVLSIFTLIPMIISLIMYMFSERGKTLHDYVSLSRVIDSNVKKALDKRRKENRDVNKLMFKE